MRLGAFEINEPLPELQEPHVIAVLRPWINVGRVGTLALSRLEQHFGAKDLGQLRYCLIGGMYDVVPHTRALLVSGSGTSPEPENQLNGLGVRSSKYEGPTTITYMVTQETEKMGVQNMTLIARLPQYVQLEEDHAGTARLIELLSSFYPIPADLADVEKGRRQYQELTAAVEQNPEVKQVLSQLEAQYDAQEATSGAAATAADVPLSPELESFLRGLEQDLGSDSA